MTDEIEGCPICGEQECRKTAPACVTCGEEHAPRWVGEQCRRRVRKQLLALPEQYVALYLALEPSSTQGEYITGSREAPLPLRGEVDAVMWDVLGVLEAWEQDVNRRLGHADEPSLRRREGVALQAAVQRLVTHTDMLCDDPSAGPIFVGEMNELARRCRTTLGQWRGKTRLPERCPDLDCEQMALVRWNGASEVVCEACLRTWSELDYERLLIVLGKKAS